MDVERVRALRPDLVLANLEENTRADVEALDASMPVFVTDVRDVSGALAMIRDVGRLTGTDVWAEELASEIEAGFASLQTSKPLRAAYLIWRRPYMSVGGDTFIHDVLARGGFENVFDGRRRYPEVTLAELADVQPDVLLLSSEPYPFREKHVAEIHARLPDTDVHLVDGEPFSWYGSRLLKTPPYLAALRASL